MSVKNPTFKAMYSEEDPFELEPTRESFHAALDRILDEVKGKLYGFAFSVVSETEDSTDCSGMIKTCADANQDHDAALADALLRMSLACKGIDIPNNANIKQVALLPIPKEVPAREKMERTAVGGSRSMTVKLPCPECHEAGLQVKLIRTSVRESCMRLSCPCGYFKQATADLDTFEKVLTWANETNAEPNEVVAKIQEEEAARLAALNPQPEAFS